MTIVAKILQPNINQSEVHISYEPSLLDTQTLGILLEDRFIEEYSKRYNPTTVSTKYKVLIQTAKYNIL